MGERTCYLAGPASDLEHMFVAGACSLLAKHIDSSRSLSLLPYIRPASQEGRSSCQTYESNMEGYQYTKLDPNTADFRLIKLLPGLECDILRFSIFNASLTRLMSPLSATPTLTLDELRKTLPEGWLVKETLDGRRLFMKMGYAGVPNRWRHPDESMPVERYWVEKGEDRKGCAVRYEALSYVWGSPEEREEVEVVSGDAEWGECMEVANGADLNEINGGVVKSKIGANLASALRHLRHPEKTRVLWADAVCISQTDVEERNAQVKRMRDVYSLAERVIVWLGPSTSDSALALETLRYFSKQVEYTIDDCIGDAPGATEPRWWDAEYRLPYDDATWAALIALFRRPWFSRVWVLQEALLAHEGLVMCGQDTISWDVLRKAVIVLNEKVGLPASLFVSLGSYRTGLLEPATWSLPRLLLWGKFRECTDPRDKIYGILSLLSEQIARGMVVDYLLPVSTVFQNALLVHVEQSKRLELLRHCVLDGEVFEGPSWVPRFATTKRSFFGFRKGHSRQPAGHSAAETRLMAPNVLEVGGVRVATVASVKAIPSGDVTSAFRNILSFAASLPLRGGYVGGGDMLDAVIEIIAKGRMRDRYPNIKPFPTHEELRSGLAAVLAGTATMDVVFNYFKEELRLESTLLFTTREGYVGVSEAQMQIGMAFPPTSDFENGVGTTADRFQVTASASC